MMLFQDGRFVLKTQTMFVAASEISIYCFLGGGTTTPNDGLNYKSKKMYTCKECVCVRECVCVMEAYFCTELQLHRIPKSNLHKYLWNCDNNWVPHLKGKSHTPATLFDTLFCSHKIWRLFIRTVGWDVTQCVLAKLTKAGSDRLSVKWNTKIW